MKNLSQDCRYTGRDLQPENSEYKSGALVTRLQRSGLPL
jgi:hypothetical protein